MRILVTGANGFVGAALTPRLLAADSAPELVAAVRSSAAKLPFAVRKEAVGDLTGRIDWQCALREVSAVVHCAGRAHVTDERSPDSRAAFRAVNVEGTLNLARQAAATGVRRFVFISSIKVNGDATRPGQPFTSADTPAPTDPYGVSKMEAEQGLREIAAQTGMEVVVIRPPLVYGPGVKANFLAMMRWLASGLPLPLGAIHNRRSLVALDNLVDLIVTCIDHPAAANRTFLVSDGEDLSTTQLLRRMGQALGKSPRLIPVPPVWLRLGFASMGKSAIAQRLCGSLQVDISGTRQLLGWRPPMSIDEGLKKAAEGYLNEASV